MTFPAVVYATAYRVRLVSIRLHELALESVSAAAAVSNILVEMEHRHSI